MFKTFKQDKKRKTFKKSSRKCLSNGDSNLDGDYVGCNEFLTKLEKPRKKPRPKQSAIFGKTPANK